VTSNAQVSSDAGSGSVNVSGSQFKDSSTTSDQSAAGQSSTAAGGAASQREAIDAAIRSLMLPSSLATFMAKSADNKAIAGNATSPSEAAGDSLQPAGKRELRNDAGEMFDSSALDSLATLVKPGGIQITSSADSDELQSQSEDEMSPAPGQAAEQGLPAKVAGFVDRFTPFDAHGMDQAIQRFMNQLQVQDQSLDGGLRLRRLAVISTAIALGIGSVEFIRRKKSGLQIPRFLTSTLGFGNVPVNS
jgi:hypothetical protein